VVVAAFGSSTLGQQGEPWFSRAGLVDIGRRTRKSASSRCHQDALLAGMQISYDSDLLVSGWVDLI
jgi:hypothetical protein